MTALWMLICEQTRLALRMTLSGLSSWPIGRPIVSSRSFSFITQFTSIDYISLGGCGVRQRYQQCVFHLQILLMVDFLLAPMADFLAAISAASSQSTLQPPTRGSWLVLAPTLPFSSPQSSGMTMSKVSLRRAILRSRSVLVVVVREGLALISRSQGLQLASRRTSKPYISKQCLSLMMTDCTALRDMMMALLMSSKQRAARSVPNTDSMQKRRHLIDHLPPCFSEYLSEYFWMATLVRCTNMLSISATSEVYCSLQKRANPLSQRQTLSGRQEVTSTQMRRSNFLPPMSRGFSTYLLMMKISLELKFLKGELRLAPGAIFLSCWIFLRRKMPWPWDLLLGLTIQVLLGARWNSSEKRLYSPGKMQVCGMKSRSQSMSPFSHSLRKRLMFLTMRSLRVSSQWLGKWLMIWPSCSRTPTLGLKMLRTFQTVAQYTFHSSSSFSFLAQPRRTKLPITTSLSKSLLHFILFPII